MAGSGSTAPVARSFHVLRSSWPSQMQTTRDPSRPSVSRIMREMESNKNEGQGSVLKRGLGGSEGTQSSATDINIGGPADPRTHRPDLPSQVLPSAAAPVAAAPLPRGGPRPGGRAAVVTPSSPGAGPGQVLPKTSNWHPPGWDEFAASHKLPMSKKRNQLDKPAQEPHNVEVMGMRVVGVLCLAVIGIEVKDLQWGPTGLTRKKKVQPGQPEPDQPALNQQKA